MGKNRRGFTLIELTIVLAVIGILAGVFIVGINPITQLKKARDAGRQNDLSQYRNGLAAYASDHNSLYPLGLDENITASSSLCTALSPYMSSCPADSTYPYHVFTGGTGTSYLLYAPLETTAGTYWEICSNAKAGKVSSKPTSVTCGL